MPDATAGVLLETVEDTIETLEATLQDLQSVTQERDSLLEDNKKLASQLDEKEVYLKKVASAAPTLDPVQIAAVVKRVEKAGFVKAGSAADAAKDLQKNPHRMLQLMDAMATAFIEDDFSEGTLVKSGSFGETAPVPKGQEGVDYFVDQDGWGRLIELAQRQAN